jgi:hypothetical protein
MSLIIIETSVRVAALNKAPTVFDSSDTGTLGSVPTGGLDVSIWLCYHVIGPRVPPNV